MINIDELQRYLIDVGRENVNPQEPPSIIPSVNNLQSLIQILDITSTNIYTNFKIDSVKKKLE